MSMTTATYLSHLMSCCRSIADVRQKFRFVVRSASLSTLKKDPVSVNVGRFKRHSLVPRRAVAVGEDDGRSEIAGRCFGCHSLIVDPASQ